MAKRVLRKPCYIHMWHPETPRDAEEIGPYKNKTKAEEHLRRLGWRENEQWLGCWILVRRDGCTQFLALIKELLPQNRLPRFRRTS